MLKTIRFLFIICVLFYSSDYEFVYAKNKENVVYAKVLENCNLYKSKEMNNSPENILFIVPESYFVLILDTIDEHSCYMVQYDNYIGYVSFFTVSKVSFIPIVKTLDNITFDIKSNAGTQIWSAPTTESNVYTTISAGTSKINYIASVKGEIPSGGKSNIWYYIYYTSELNATNVYQGYVYSENTTNLSEIIVNTEDEPTVILEDSYDDDIIYISSTFKTIVVAIIAIPILLFLCIILYKLTKKIKKNTKYDKNLIKTNANSTEDIGTKKINLKDKFRNMLRVKSHKNNHQNFDLQDDELL